MDPKLKQQDALADTLPGGPRVREHGMYGSTESAVGGFGESYAFQVAHGAASESPGTPSDSERAVKEGRSALEQAVLKSLAQAHIDAANLWVEAVGSEVRLHGTVRHSFEKAELEARARLVPGVRSVVSELALLQNDARNSG